MKTKSKAYKEVELYRDMMNAGKTKITAKDLSCVVYLGNTDYLGAERLIARGYSGRSKKQDFNYYFTSEEKRAKYVSDYMKRRSERYNKRRATVERELEVGDVLCASWGYEQTNIDYYEVTKLIGKTMVEVREIASCRAPNGYDMQGTCVPLVGQYTSEPMRKKASGKGVRISSCQYATKIEPKEVLPDGTKIYESRTWTAYH